MAKTREAFRIDPANPGLAWLVDAASVYSWSPTGERLAVVPSAPRGRRVVHCYNLSTRERVATLRTEGWVRELFLASDDALWVFTDAPRRQVVATCHSLPAGAVIARVALPTPAGGSEASLYAEPAGSGDGVIFVRAMGAPDARDGWRACVLGTDGDPTLRAIVPAVAPSGARTLDCVRRPKDGVLATLDDARRVRFIAAPTGEVLGGPIEVSASVARLNWVGDETLSVVSAAGLDLIEASTGQRRVPFPRRAARADGWESKIERVAVHRERPHLLVVERLSLQIADSYRGASKAHVWNVNARTGAVVDVFVAHDDNHDLSRGLIATWSGRALDVLELHARIPIDDAEENPVSLMLHRNVAGGWQQDMVLSTELGPAGAPISLLEVPRTRWIAPCCPLAKGGLQIGLLDPAVAYGAALTRARPTAAGDRSVVVVGEDDDSARL